MKSFDLFKSVAVLMCCATFSAPVFAHEGQGKEANPAVTAAGKLLKVDEAGVSAEWLAKAKADYPLDTCMVSDDKLEEGEMGPPQDMIFRQEGKSDRLVRFCCNHCVRDFKKDPAGYLRAIDDAAAKKAKK